MHEWKKAGWLVVASVGVLLVAGAGGRSSAWATADGEDAQAILVGSVATSAQVASPETNDSASK
jgi:hypothetical protein